MTTVPTNLQEARDALRQVRHKASPFVERFARFGYAAKGSVYVMIGVFAGMAAIGARSSAAGSRGAMAAIAHQPFGKVMLGVVALGLTCFALWQFIRAIENPEHARNPRRIGFFGSGVVHFGLVWYAIGVITGAARGGDDDAGARTWSATAMTYPMGQWLVFFTGCGIVCYGIFQLARALRRNLGKRLHAGELDPRSRGAVVAMGRFGIAARGIVFGIIGVFLALAAYHHNPNEARGIAGALESLQLRPYGPWLLGIAGIGLIAYGAYMLMLARYRRVSAA